MRTTITLPDPLLENAKEAAEQRGITVSELEADALRTLLAQSAKPSAKPFRPHTMKGKNLPIHAEFSREAALEDEAEIDPLFRKRGRAAGPEPFALSEPVMQQFISPVTNPRFFQPRSSMEDALRFLNSLLSLPHCVRIRRGARHWELLRRLWREVNAKDPMVADAAHAAPAVESGCEWITFDTDFARFAPPLRWRRLPE